MENKTQNGFNSRIIVVKEQIGGLEDQVKKFFQKVLRRDKEMKIMQEKLKTWKKITIHLVGAPDADKD